MVNNTVPQPYVRGLMVKVTGTGKNPSSAYLPAVTSLALGLSSKNTFVKGKR
jgi:hypothetical protein